MTSDFFCMRFYDCNFPLLMSTQFFYPVDSQVILSLACLNSAEVPALLKQINRSTQKWNMEKKLNMLFLYVTWLFDITFVWNCEAFKFLIDFQRNQRRRLAKHHRKLEAVERKRQLERERRKEKRDEEKVSSKTCQTSSFISFIRKSVVKF